jgi:DNA mismatch repair protein MutL
MSDMIRLLPDAVANQIAAGEVIQRPASAVKELLENAVDAGATQVKLVVRDAGKALLQVVDNGIGMSETDARMSFERHATSKIRKADDLFTLHTMGFRGEALASIASVAQVELRTRLRNSEVGTRIIIEGSEFKAQEPAALPEGTSIAIKNLFYNVPARRNFLKSNPIEIKHIQEEFTRVALANPEIAFSLHHNDLQVFDLRSGNLRQRISALFGANYNERIVPVEEETSIMRLEGFVIRPEHCKKQRGDQYFFVNNRFIRDNYLHHAVSSAYENLITKDMYAGYWLKIQIDPSAIDVNIHPSKTEIKFQDDKSVYAILRAAVKRTLGKFSVAPSLDFDQERAFHIPLEKMNSIPVQPVIKVNPNYNPFDPQPSRSASSGSGYTPIQRDWNDRDKAAAWLDVHEKLQGVQAEVHVPEPATEMRVTSLASELESLDDERFVQCGPRLAVITSAAAMYIIDLPLVHERVLYEQYHAAMTEQVMPSQQQLFPPQFEVTPTDAMLLNELNEDLRRLGFDLSPFGALTFVIHGIPADLASGDEQKTLMSLLDQYRENEDRLRLDRRENLIRAMAKSMSLKTGRINASKEIRHLVLQLLDCETPRYSVNGKLIFQKVQPDELQRFLEF